MQDQYSAVLHELDPEVGKLYVEAPSNIALVKYWGKEEVQIPKNPSISFTLEKSKTKTSITYRKKDQNPTSAVTRFLFAGEDKPSFLPKINTFFKRIQPFVPLISGYEFEIESENTFPHSSGIASSASSMCALGLAVAHFEAGLDKTFSENEVRKKASFLARLGSGSASRSVSGPVMIWGEHPSIPESSNEYAIPLKSTLHPIFNEFRDTILLIDTDEKKVSSTVGHDLMNHHPYAEERFRQGYGRTFEMVKVLESGDLENFIRLTESEALTLHAMMMASSPYFLLMKPNTLKAIEKIWAYRKETKSGISFTLDAGANVHLLYPKNEEVAINAFITSELKSLCANGSYIKDTLGNGSRIEKK